jgi:hypothetical protein
MNKRELKKWREDYTVWDAPCLGEGLTLHVHFDEKDDVKRMGGRWNPDPSGKGGHWWMPINKLDQTCPFEDEEFWGPGGSGTVRDWLNNHKMIAGQHGVLDTDECHDAIQGNLGLSGESTRYELVHDDESAIMEVYPQLGIVQVETSHGETDFATIEHGREMWNSLMQSGYRKIVTKEEVSA